MNCPDNHRWWQCAHPDLANKPLGIAVMVVGAMNIVLALALVLR